MSRIDRFMAVMAAGMLLLTIAVASLLLFAGTSGAAQAAEATVPAAGAQPASSSRLFDSLDRNKDQVLSRQEFQSGYAGLQRFIVMQGRLHEQFGALDVDRSGAIDGDEYANLELIKRLGNTAPSLSIFDANHDQKLGFAEYAEAVHKLAMPQPSTKK
ncbi:EF-hand domain-containing protein [Lysobacter tyrosinilyticus]